MGVWEKIKNWLKLFWPLTIHRFNRRMQEEHDRTADMIQEQTQLILTETSASVKSLRTNLEKSCQESIRKLLEEEDRIFYYCPHEVRSIKAGGFYEARQSLDYLTDYQHLVEGLDRESIETVNRILSRHLAVQGKSEDHLNLFSQKEQAIIEQQRQEFYADVVQIAPGVFACGKYLLATPEGGMGFTETAVFLDRAGYGLLEHPERVRDKDILDLGAFIGDSAIVLAECTDKNVYAFEPGSDNFKALEKTVELNRCSRIIPVHAGIGAESGEALIQARLWMGLTLQTTTPDTGCTEGMESIPIVSVDEFVAEHQLQIGLIKVDVEGFEQAFLKGAEHTLRTQRPALLLSMYHNASDFFHLKPILEDMDLGYRFKVHKEINEHIHYDTMLIAEAE